MMRNTYQKPAIDSFLPTRQALGDLALVLHWLARRESSRRCTAVVQFNQRMANLPQGPAKDSQVTNQSWICSLPELSPSPGPAARAYPLACTAHTRFTLLLCQISSLNCHAAMHFWAAVL